jgi:DNA invertase Pin-like site-specific DNA recombinase
LHNKTLVASGIAMKVGYARVSTDDQKPALQTDALRKAGCEKLFTDRGVSGAAATRPQLDRCLKALDAGDVLVVWKLDRLGRNLAHLIETIEALRSRGVGFQSLSEAIDTTSAHGKLLLHVLGALAEFERSLIAERTAAGRAAAVKRGVRLGRPTKLSVQQIKHARELRASGKAVPDVAELLNVSRYTVYRATRVSS